MNGKQGKCEETRSKLWLATEIERRGCVETWVCLVYILSPSLEGCSIQLDGLRCHLIIQTPHLSALEKVIPALVIAGGRVATSRDNLHTILVLRLGTLVPTNAGNQSASQGARMCIATNIENRSVVNMSRQGRTGRNDCGPEC